MRAQPLLLLCVAVLACEPARQAIPATSDGQQVSTVATSSSLPNDVSYTVLSDEALPPHKRSLDILLNQKVSEEVLSAIAHELRSRDARSFQRTFIVYYLPGMEVGAGGWATSHFDPTLKIAIQGLTRAEETAVASDRPSPARDVIGQWLDDRPYVGNRITIYRSGGKLLLERKFRDGSSSDETLRERSTSRGRRFEEIGNESGEYYLINSSGDLQIWDSEGLVATARKVN